MDIARPVPLGKYTVELLSISKCNAYTLISRSQGNGNIIIWYQKTPLRSPLHLFVGMTLWPTYFHIDYITKLDKANVNVILSFFCQLQNNQENMRHISMNHINTIFVKRRRFYSVVDIQYTSWNNDSILLFLKYQCSIRKMYIESSLWMPQCSCNNRWLLDSIVHNSQLDCLLSRLLLLTGKRYKSSTSMLLHGMWQLTCHCEVTVKWKVFHVRGL